MELLKPLLKEVTDAVRYNVIARGQRDGKGKTLIRAELFKEVVLKLLILELSVVKLKKKICSFLSVVTKPFFT